MIINSLAVDCKLLTTTMATTMLNGGSTFTKKKQTTSAIRYWCCCYSKILNTECWLLWSFHQITHSHAHSFMQSTWAINGLIEMIESYFVKSITLHRCMFASIVNPIEAMFLAKRWCMQWIAYACLAPHDTAITIVIMVDKMGKQGQNSGRIIKAKMYANDNTPIRPKTNSSKP